MAHELEPWPKYGLGGRDVFDDTLCYGDIINASEFNLWLKIFVHFLSLNNIITFIIYFLTQKSL